VLGVQQWAEVRRLVLVEGRSQREVARLTGLARDTVARAVASQTPPKYVRAPAGSKLDPFREWICEQLREDPTIQAQRLRELAGELGYEGGRTIFDDYVREVRPRFLVRRTFQRTLYRPGELVQCDLWEPREPVPVGRGQTRRGWVVTCELCWSRVIAGALIFSKQAPDILWGLGRCLGRIGALPEKLVWDREGAIAPGGRPSDEFAAFCGQLGVGWVILDAGDAQAKGALERSHRFMRANFVPGRRFANPLDFQLQLDGWCERVNRRVHRTTRAVPAERLLEERERMRPLPAALPDTDRRQVTRVPQQPYLRLDRNDYSIDPAFAGRRVEVRVSQTEITAVVLDTGELACRHRRSFAGGLTITDPAHQRGLERQRERRRQRHDIDVEVRPLARYDQLIPA
jgi:transposase